MSEFKVAGKGRARLEAPDKVVQRTLVWIEKNAREIRMQDRDTGATVRAGGH